MKKFITYIQDLLSDDSGNASSMRVLVCVIVLCVLFNWTYHNVAQHVYASLDLNGVVAMTSALLAKAWQKKTET